MNRALVAFKRKSSVFKLLEKVTLRRFTSVFSVRSCFLIAVALVITVGIIELFGNKWRVIPANSPPVFSVFTLRPRTNTIAFSSFKLESHTHKEKQKRVFTQGLSLFNIYVYFVYILENLKTG